MSELKTRYIDDTYVEYYNTGKHELAQIYLKQDVDKLIAEKDEQIDEFKEHIDELQKATDSAWSKVNAMYDALRHHKYKRCLAMAKMCGIMGAFEDGEWYAKWINKWYKRWLELAEKFKETK